MVDQQAREAALKQYSYTIEELVHDEEAAHRKKEEAERKEVDRQLHKVRIVFQSGHKTSFRPTETCYNCCQNYWDTAYWTIWDTKSFGHG